MERRIVIQWTDTAKSQLALFDKKVRRGLLNKADALRHCSDPRRAHKALVGPLAGHFRMTYGRYRAIYSVKEEKLASGDVLVYVRVQFVAVGQRKERDKRDIYKVAEKMLGSGVISLPKTKDESTQFP